jgi:hypothetical protein
MIEMVGVLIAAANGEHAGAQNVGEAVRHQRRIARIGDQRCQHLRDTDAPLGAVAEVVEIRGGVVSG